MLQKKSDEVGMAVVCGQHELLARQLLHAHTDSTVTARQSGRKGAARDVTPQKASYQCVSLVVGQIGWQAGGDGLREELLVALPGCIVHARCQFDGLGGQRRGAGWAAPGIVLAVAHVAVFSAVRRA